MGRVKVSEEGQTPLEHGSVRASGLPRRAAQEFQACNPTRREHNLFERRGRGRRRARRGEWESRAGVEEREGHGGPRRGTWATRLLFFA
ncbi:hypothetical protein E2C01_075238 [Portunus trituberculatus]|uniref:Uncharacterized protein n=1 Tax=Portunus trituberculatus TaxID=210409 RepID=A0A5B7I5L9_PORTR|nr:hypothetical protein [Portunus trituberculatus]